MLSPIHESLVTLFRQCPPRVPTILSEIAGITIPDDTSVRVTSAEFAELSPAEHSADIVLVVRDEDDTLCDVFIVEVQLSRDAKQRRSWLSYVAGAGQRYQCPATIVAVAVDESLARWCAQPFKHDRAGSVLLPLVIGWGVRFSGCGLVWLPLSGAN